MKIQKYTVLMLMALLIGLTGCGSAAKWESTGYEPVTITVTGFVPGQSTGGTSKALQSEGCAADTVHATDISGITASARVGEGCFFSLGLEIGKTYSLGLSRGDEFVASLLFSGRDGLSSYTLRLEDGSEISLGTIFIAGEHAFPENEPLDQGDAQSADSQADDVDEAEEDTDIGDMGEDSLSDGEPRIIKVTPRNGVSDVAVGEVISVQTSCSIDPDSVSEAVFNVGDSEGDHVICDVSLSESQKEVVCQHDDFLTGMNYTLTVEGLQCADESGGTIRTLTWHFKTE